VRGVLNGLVADTSRTAIVDLEAGLEHLSRGTARHVDTLFIVGEPYFKSLETAGRSFALAKDLGIKRIWMVANKIRGPRDEDSVREFAGRHGLPVAGVVPFDDAVVGADENGAALIEYRPASPSVTAIRRLADELLAGAGAGQRGR
jgi:CO dehydrogenase maturation factor